MTNKKSVFSRRGFLKGVVQTASVAVLAKVFKVIPEAKGVFAGTTIHRGSRLPDNTQVNELSGNEAKNVIAQALSDRTSRKLQASLDNFSPQTDEAKGMTISQTDEKTKEQHEGPAVAIPFSDGTGTEAFLFFTAIDGFAQSAMSVIIMDGEDFLGIDVYQVKNGDVVVERVTWDQAIASHQTRKGAIAPTMGSSCTYENMIDCMRRFGCSGYGLTVGMAAFLACVLAPPACIIAFACILYCGGAFSLCWDYIGCP